MNSHPQTRLRPHAFTLVELLTVIAIIAILMGLLFPAIGVVKEQARKAETKTACTGIVAAVKAYNTEYGKYPVLGFTGTPDLWYAETGASVHDNSLLFAALRPKAGVTPTPDYNPRKIVFFEGKDASNPAAVKGGFAPTGSTNATVGGFYDPWGTQYNVLIDANYDNVIENVPHTDFSGATKGPQTGCAVFSVGKDTKVGSTATGTAYKSGSNTSDDILSWQ